MYVLGDPFFIESFLSKKIIVKQNSLRTLSSKCRGHNFVGQGPIRI